MEAHRASYNSRKNAICPGVYAVITNGICAANVKCNCSGERYYMASNKQHFFDTYLIWINCNTKESGVEFRSNIFKLYGAVVDKALNIDKLQTIKSDFGLQFYQPDARIVSDIMYRFLNAQESVCRTQAFSADECEAV
jgi:hypothetical protein